MTETTYHRGESTARRPAVTRTRPTTGRRRLVARLTTSLDGIVEAPEGAPEAQFLDDPEHAVEQLDAESGGDVVFAGGVGMVRALLVAGLVDELHVMIHPRIRGEGEQLFPFGTSPIPLTVLSSQTLPSGILEVRYAPAGR